jgi:hypothetical protein
MAKPSRISVTKGGPGSSGPPRHQSQPTRSPTASTPRATSVSPTPKPQGSPGKTVSGYSSAKVFGSNDSSKG